MNDEIYLNILKLLEKNPELSQRELAQLLGISLGKTNYCLKALKEKGWIKWSNFSNNPNKSQYLHVLTPVGMAEKLVLTVRFLQRKQAEYEELKREFEELTKKLNHQDKLSVEEPKLMPGIEH
jgi:EPS-associated MarR family transcriptional regulator